MISPPLNQFQRPGQNSYANASLASGATDIVTGAANVNGLVVRTATLGGGPGGGTSLSDGNNAFFLNGPSGTANATTYTGTGLLIPPGRPLRVSSNGGGGGSAFITWDAL